MNALVVTLERDIAQATSLLRIQLALVALAIVASWRSSSRSCSSSGRSPAGGRPAADGEGRFRRPPAGRVEGRVRRAGHRFQPHGRAPGGSYRTLERRVADKTRSLAEKNRGSRPSTRSAALLNAPGSIEDLCRGFLRRLLAVTGAAAGAVRLIDTPAKHVHLYVHEGLDAGFVAEEHCLDMGECLCGEAAQTARPVIHVISAARR